MMKFLVMTSLWHKVLGITYGYYMSMKEAIYLHLLLVEYTECYILYWYWYRNKIGKACNFVHELDLIGPWSRSMTTDRVSGDAGWRGTYNFNVKIWE